MSHSSHLGQEASLCASSPWTLISREEQGGTTFVLGVHGALPGSAGSVRRVSFHHDLPASEPRVLDGYVLAVLLLALEHVDRIVVKGPVSARALRNVHILGEAWHSWRPDRYRPVEIIPEAVVSEAECRAARDPHQPARAIAAFSGGVDGTFLALRHATGQLGRASYPLADVVLVQGFDVARQNTAAFEALLERTKPLTDSLDLRVHVVRTDIREQLAQDWEHSFGAQLACVLHQFSDRFEYGLIGSGEPYNRQLPVWGSTPATDYLLSGGAFDIVHEGAGYSRTEKVAVIAGNSVARRTLKVCWAGPDQGRNCGTCEKCVRTRLNFLAAGVPAPECFDTPFDPGSIPSLSVTSENQIVELESILEFVERDGLNDAWVAMLRERVRDLRADHPPEQTTRLDAPSQEASTSPTDRSRRRPRQRRSHRLIRLALGVGIRLGLPNPLFDAVWYQRAYAGVPDGRLRSWRHWRRGAHAAMDTTPTSCSIRIGT